jgi:Phosphate-selective porin O and P
VAQAGQFKAPFSRELLTSAGELDFIERARVVNALAPGRQRGIEARGRLAGSVEYGIGAFNGNGTGSANDDNRLLGVARLGWWVMGAESGASRRLELAVNGGYSHDEAVNLPGLDPSFRGQRTLWGADFRYSDRRWLVAAEAIGSRLDYDSTGAVVHPHGWQATAGYHVSPRVQLLARWDALHSDGLGPDGDLLIAGLRAWPTGAVQFRLEDVVDPDQPGIEHHRFMFGGQFGF